MLLLNTQCNWCFVSIINEGEMKWKRKERKLNKNHIYEQLEKINKNIWYLDAIQQQQIRTDYK